MRSSHTSFPVVARIDTRQEYIRLKGEGQCCVRTVTLMAYVEIRYSWVASSRCHGDNTVTVEESVLLLLATYAVGE